MLTKHTQDVSEKLADFFNNHFSNLDLNINSINDNPNNNNNINNSKYIPSNIPILDNLDNYFNFNDVKIIDILLSLKQINESHSDDVYRINYKFFKTIISYNIQYFANLINMSFRGGIFPEILNYSKRITILKYKSISKTSTIIDRLQ